MIGFLFFLLILAIIAFLLLRYGVSTQIAKRGDEIFKMRRISYHKVVLIIIGAILFIILVPASIRVVPVGKALVIFNVINKRYYVSREGINYIPPIINRTIMYDLRRQEYTMTGMKGEGRRKNVDDALWSPTKEGLKVGLDLTCWYRINPERVFDVHRFIGPNFEEKVIRPAIRGIVRLTVSEYGTMDIYSGKREQVQNEILRRLKTLLEPDGFVVDGVVLRNVSFSPDFAKAVEEKQMAQQDAERMKYILEKEQKEAERKAIEAEGKARAIEIVSKQLRQNPQYIRYLYVDKLANNVKVIVSDQPTLMGLEGLLKGK